MKYWKKRKELFVGYMDGSINVYSLTKNLEKIKFTGSFRMHGDVVHRISILEDLNFAVSSGYDSCLKIWRPPEEWETKVVVTHSMVEGINPNINLSTIREETESQMDPESMVPMRRHLMGEDQSQIPGSLLRQL